MTDLGCLRAATLFDFGPPILQSKFSQELCIRPELLTFLALLRYNGIRMSAEQPLTMISIKDCPSSSVAKTPTQVGVLVLYYMGFVFLFKINYIYKWSGRRALIQHRRIGGHHCRSTLSRMAFMERVERQCPIHLCLVSQSI